VFWSREREESLSGKKGSVTCSVDRQDDEKSRTGSAQRSLSHGKQEREFPERGSGSNREKSNDMAELDESGGYVDPRLSNEP